MKQKLLICCLALMAAGTAGAQDKSHFILRYKYSKLFPIGISIGGGITDHDNIRLNFGFAQPRTGNEWGEVLPAPEGSSPQQPSQPSQPSGPSGGGGPQPQQPPQPQPEIPDVKIDGTAFYTGVAWDHFFTSWFGVYSEADLVWLNSLPEKDESISSSSSTPPPQKENIYFCIPIEAGINLKLSVLTISAGYQYHYKGYSSWTASVGLTF